ncbi:MAG: hypothetical protein KJ749_05650 [Planctomycetes bacterium]|nr:hypothetical protein [Planctomycetota bacterium]
MSPANCGTCHPPEAEHLAKSVHTAIRCQECHGGESSYSVLAAKIGEHTRRLRTGAISTGFDHGAKFRGKPDRASVPLLCGTCHADVVRMNPYGLRTDQLARYWTSGHGKALAEKGEERVAVCTDCHGTHEVLRSAEPSSSTNPLKVPDTCATCHADKTLMAAFGLPVEPVDEYRRSIHGQLLLEQLDTGAPTCATCHGNHSAMPPGFATVGAVCGQCHQRVAQAFSTSVHAEMEGHKGCVQCHGGGEGRHFHLIERITQPTEILIRRYTDLLASEPSPTPEQVSDAVHPEPRLIMDSVLPTCLECHDEPDEDESLAKMFSLMDDTAKSERHYLETASRVDQIGRGVLLVDRQRFLLGDARTHLIELGALQHTLDAEKVAAKVSELDAVCDMVNEELDGLERGLDWRRRALIPIWIFAVLFAIALYAKYKRLRAIYVKPLPEGWVGY